MSDLRAALVLLRRARRQWKSDPSMRTAVALQWAQRHFEEAKRDAIKALD